MSKLIPNEELTFHSWENCRTVMDILLDEGYVLLLSRECDLYILNYIWTSEAEPNRNDVVFMDRAEFEEKFYEYDPDDCYYERFTTKEAREDGEQSAWNIAKKLLNASCTEIEEIFGVVDADEKTQDRFWEMWPNKITFSEAQTRVKEWDRKRMEPIEDASIDAAMEYWDQLNREKYEDELSRSSEEIQPESNS